jgi:hypothetical protein
MTPKHIPGGYILLARVTMEKTLWRLDAETFRLAIFCLMRAQYGEARKLPNGDVANRGEFGISLSMIAEECEFFDNRINRRWSRQKVARMLDELQSVGFIKYKSDSNGTLISVCNYDTYQNPDNYKSDTHGTVMEHSWNSDGTVMDTNNKDKKEKKEKNTEACASFPDLFPDTQPEPKAKKPRKGDITQKPTIEEVQSFAVEVGLPASDGAAMFWKWEGNGWSNGNKPIKNWQAVIRQWKSSGWLPSQKNPQPKPEPQGEDFSQYSPENLARREKEQAERSMRELNELRISEGLRPLGQ